MFRIYYDDGHCSDSLRQVRKTGAQLVAEVYEGRKYMHMGGDWLCYNGHWQCRTEPHDLALKCELIDIEVFEQLKKKAFKWLLQTS